MTDRKDSEVDIRFIKDTLAKQRQVLTVVVKHIPDDLDDRIVSEGLPLMYVLNHSIDEYLDKVLDSQENQGL